MTIIRLQDGTYAEAVALSRDLTSSSRPLTGSADSTGYTPTGGAKVTTGAPNFLIGPFTPQLGREIWVTLSGAGSSGTAQLLRSTDGGATKLGLTVAGQPWGSFPFAGITDLAPAANEIVTAETDASATYYLALTVTQGTVNYRVAQ